MEAGLKRFRLMHQNKCSMKFIGFLKQHSPEVLCAKQLDEMLSEGEVDKEIFHIVIDYLDQGAMVFKFLLGLSDNDGEYIGSYIIYSDGEWVWPSYFKFYIEKYKISPSSDFIDYVKGRARQRIKITREDIRYVEYVFLKETGENFDRTKIPELVQKMIDKRGQVVKCY